MMLDIIKPTSGEIAILGGTVTEGKRRASATCRRGAGVDVVDQVEVAQDQG